MYTNQQIDLKFVANQFNLSEGYVSQLINTNTGTNFSTYINKLRIEESKRILADKQFENYTIVSIALESGFNSKSVFYKNFKEHTGLTPLEFKNQN